MDGAPALDVKSVRELTAVMSSPNLLRVRLRANFDLVGGAASITVTGLVGAGTASALGPLCPVARLQDLLPNCSCAVPIGTIEQPALECESCSAAARATIGNFRVWQADFDGTSTFLGTPADDGWHPTGNDLDGSWDKDSGTLIVSIAPGKTFPAGRVFDFAFVLQNAASPRDPVTPRVAVRSGSIALGLSPLDGRVFGADATAALDVKALEERTGGVDGGFATLDVALEGNAPMLSPGAALRITVRGLVGYSTPSGPLTVGGHDGFLAAKSAIAIWRNDAAMRAVLILPGGTLLGGCGSLPAGQECALGAADRVPGFGTARFSVTLRKQGGLYVRPAVPGVQISVSSPFMSLYAADMAASWRDTSLMEPRFFDLAVTESSTVRLQGNVLSFSLTSNVQLFPSSSLTISGLLGASVPAGPLPLAGPSASLFEGEAGEWSGGHGAGAGRLRLVIAAGQTYLSHTPIELHVALKNPPSQQPAVKVSVSGTVRFRGGEGDYSEKTNITIPQTEFPERVLSGAFVPTFEVTEVSELSRVSTAANLITFAVRSNANLPAGTVLRLTNINSASLNASRLLVSGDDVLSGAVSNTSVLLVPGSCSQAGWGIDCAGGFDVELLRAFETGERIEFSTLLKNPDTLEQAPPGRTQPHVAALVVVEGGGLLPLIEEAPMKADVLGGGVPLAWVVKTVAEQTEIKRTLNRVEIRLSANARLFAGSVFEVTGLSGVETVCRPCLGKGEDVPGLGCSDGCLTCPIDTVCVPIFKRTDASEGGVEPHALLAPLATFDTSAGVLTVVLNGTLPAEEAVSFSLFVRNPSATQSRGRECSAGSSAVDITSGSCLTVRAGPVSLCDSTAPADDPSACLVQSAAGGMAITASSQTVGRLGEPLLDTCAVCLRPADLFAVQEALAAQETFIVDDLSVYPPSLLGVNTLIAGGVARGTYALMLRLTNWLGQAGFGRYTFSKLRGKEPVGPQNEYTRPLITIEGYDTHREITAAEPLSLVANARAATCSLVDPGALGAGELHYSWTMECREGPCSRVRPLAQLSRSGTTGKEVAIAPGSLPPGVLLAFEATVSQRSIDRTSSVAVFVRTRVRALVPLIAGVAPRGRVAAAADLPLSAERCFDPEAAVTGLTAGPPPTLWVPGEQRPMPRALEPSSDPDGPAPLLLEGIYPRWTCSRTADVCAELASGGWCAGAARVDCAADGAPQAAGWAAGAPTHSVLERPVVPAAWLRADHVYELRLEVARGAEHLANASLTAPADFALPAAASVVFAAVDGPAALPVYLTVCDPQSVGTPRQCETSFPAPRLSADRALALRAAVDPAWPGADPLPRVLWESLGEVHSGLMAPSPLIRTEIDAPLLVVAPGLLTPGHTVKLRVTVTDAGGVTGYAELEAPVNVPPLGGALEIFPRAGRALHTPFQLESHGWTVDAESLPLTFSFAAIDPDMDALRTDLGATRDQAIVSQLPPGAPARGFRLAVHLTVTDAWGSTSFRTGFAEVGVTTNSTSELHALLAERLDAATSAGDDRALGQLLTQFGPLLNNVQGACAGVAAARGAPADCQALLVERKAIRLGLLDEQARLLARTEVASDESLLQAGVALKGLTQQPLELDAAGVRAAVATAVATLQAAGAAALRPAELPVSLAYAFSHLLAAIRAGAGAPSATGRRAAVAAGVTPVDAEARALTREVLMGVAAVSSQSVRGRADGEAATVVDGGSFKMYTARVATAGFTGLRIAGNRSSALFPRRDRAAARDGGGRAAAARVCRAHAHRVALLRQSRGRLARPDDLGAGAPARLQRLLRVRAARASAGSAARGALRDGGVRRDQRLHWAGSRRDRHVPRRRGVGVEPRWARVAAGERGQDSGGGCVPPLALFGPPSRHGLRRHPAILQGSRPHPAPRPARRLRPPRAWLRHGAGPVQINDHCTVCGGDNTTCSGCDGVPNSGRNRLCSGHGQCGSTACSCSERWFGGEVPPGPATPRRARARAAR